MLTPEMLADNAEINIKRATEALQAGQTEYGVGLINDAINDLKDLKQKVGQ